MARTTATAKILNRLAKGMDDAERIAREAGCSRAYVDRVAQREGYTLKSRLRDAAATRKAIAKLVARKKKAIEIQEALGLSKRLVGYHLAVLGAVTPRETIAARTAERRADVRKRRLQGEAVTSLAEAYEVPPPGDHQRPARLQNPPITGARRRAPRADPGLPRQGAFLFVDRRQDEHAPERYL